MEHIIKRYAKCQQIYHQFLEVLFINWTNNVQTGPFKFLPNSPENDQREYVAAPKKWLEHRCREEWRWNIRNIRDIRNIRRSLWGRVKMKYWIDGQHRKSSLPLKMTSRFGDERCLDWEMILRCFYKEGLCFLSMLDNFDHKSGFSLKILFFC